MADGRLEAQWGQTSQVLSLLYANVRLQCKNPPKALGPEDFNPYAKKSDAPKLSIKEFAALYIHKKC